MTSAAAIVLCRMLTRVAVVTALLLPLLAQGRAVAQAGVPEAPGADRVHGIAMHGEPALPESFRHLPHVNPDAPKGGTIRLGVYGGFDNLNPFTIKGTTPPGLRENIFESLLGRNASEPFTLYGLVAASLETAADRSAVTFHLRPEARFSDGTPLTAEDVAYSRQILAEKGWPNHRLHYNKVARTDVLSPHTIRFTFKSGGDRELPLILGLMPIVPRHKISREAIERTTLEPVVGSGPYVIGRIDAGRSLVYRRNPDYWGRNLPLMRGRFNFDEIAYEFYRDHASMFEGFKAGDIDMRVEDDPTRWAEGYDFPAMRAGEVKRREVPIALPAGMSALVFNARRAPFDDVRVRRALIWLLDAEWINRNLYHSLYRRTQSYFARSELAAVGRPADVRERELLGPFAGVVRPEIMEGLPFLPTSDGSGNNRAAMKEASRLLAEAGYAHVGGRMVHTRTGRPLTFEFLASSRSQERLVLAWAKTLERLGIALRLRQVDSAQYSARTRSFDFDMVQVQWNASLSPGNEQYNRWSAAAATAEGSFNFAGVVSPAADAMIAALLSADRREDFVSAVRALDRVLLSGDYVVPLFHVPGAWLAWRATRVAFPERGSLAGVDPDTWWAVR
jgi:peptide/nickel transport system substrate-binding protein